MAWKVIIFARERSFSSRQRNYIHNERERITRDRKALRPASDLSHLHMLATGHEIAHATHRLSLFYGSRRRPLRGTWPDRLEAAEYASGNVFVSAL